MVPAKLSGDPSRPPSSPLAGPLASAGARGTTPACSRCIPNPYRLPPARKLTGGRLLLHRNAAVTWFILVPETEAADLLDLPEAQLNSIMADGRALSVFLKNERNFPKVNFGAIGNLVPQLHLHIVGHPEDACWPQPVWGNLPEGPAYTEPEIETLRNQLIEHCDLQPVD